MDSFTFGSMDSEFLLLGTQSIRHSENLRFIFFGARTKRNRFCGPFKNLSFLLSLSIPGLIAFNLFAQDMQFEAVGDNAPVMVKYMKCNPKTKLVQVAKTPSEKIISNWKSGRFFDRGLSKHERTQGCKSSQCPMFYL